MSPIPNSKVDAYIAAAAPFARPILQHVRYLVHEVAPDVEEAMKWSFPHFVQNGAIVCGMAAFKAHCAVTFWHKDAQKLIASERGTAENAMGALGRIAQLKDLPPDRDLRRYLKLAVELAQAGKPARPQRSRKPRPALPVPDDLAAALQKSAAARKTFEGFSPSHRREYIEWITEAKRPETRAKRLATTLEWLRKGKPRNWAYM